MNKKWFTFFIIIGIVVFCFGFIFGLKISKGGTSMKENEILKIEQKLYQNQQKVVD
jgi:hypothetical protein